MLLFFLVSEMLNALIDVSNIECLHYYYKVITLGRHWCNMGILVILCLH